jgi:pathogenesis-related protein 1
MSVAKFLGLIFACAMVITMQLQTTTLAQSTPQDYLDGHNAARADVGVEDLSWNDTLQAYAENYANLRKSDCSLTHSNGPYGENIYGGLGGTEFYAADAVKSWVSEKQYYDYDTNTCSLGELIDCGHYTQVVWRDTTQLGCARVVCDNNSGMFIICSYYPPGNYPGEKPY